MKPALSAAKAAPLALAMILLSVLGSCGPEAQRPATTTALMAADRLLESMQTAQVHEMAQKKASDAITRVLDTSPHAGKVDGTAFSTATTEVNQIRDEIKEVMEADMAWKQVKPDYIKAYTAAFTEEELKELLAFYQSPLGRKLAQQQPVILADIQQANQKRLAGVTAKIRKITAKHKAVKGAQ